MANLNQVETFIHNLESVYGPLGEVDPTNWVPHDLPMGHRGRHLWTDALGVLNFLTLHRVITTQDPPVGNPDSTAMLIRAKHLVKAVHDTLGYTRDGTSRLPGATDENPLGGGLRAGELNAFDSPVTGQYRDGQVIYHLTLWMFALNRLTLASNDPVYNGMAITLAKAVHPFFFQFNEETSPAVFQRSAIYGRDGRYVVVDQDMDPKRGFVVYNLLQATHLSFFPGAAKYLEEEIKDYDGALTRTGGFKIIYQDTMEVGMAMWASQWVFDEDKMYDIMKQDSFHMNRLLHSRFEHRAAYREFGLCLGIGCILGFWHVDLTTNAMLTASRRQIINMWHDPLLDFNNPPGAQTIRTLLYAAALIPGAFRAGFFGPEPCANLETTLEDPEYWYRLAEDYGDVDGLGAEYFNRLTDRLTDHSDDEYIYCDCELH